MRHLHAGEINYNATSMMNEDMMMMMMVMNAHIHCESKKQGTTILSITSPNVDRSSNPLPLTDPPANRQQKRHQPSHHTLRVSLVKHPYRKIAKIWCMHRYQQLITR